MPLGIKFNSIRSRLTLAFIAVAMVPLLVLAGLIGWQSFGTMQNQAIELQQAITRDLATEIKAFVSERRNELDLLVEVSNLGKLDPETQRNVLADLMANQSAYEELVLLDEDGREQIRLSRSEVVLEADLVSRADSDVFLIPRETEDAYYSPVRFDETIREPLITLSLPIIDLRSGELVNVLVAELRFEAIWNLLGNFQGGGKNVYVIDSQGYVIAHPDPSVVLRRERIVLPSDRVVSGRFQGLSGPDVVLAATPVTFGDQTLVVVAEQPYSEALSLAYRLLATAGGITAIALALAVVSGFIVVRQIVSPIEDLAGAVSAIQSGNLSQKVHVGSDDEIGHLAEAFNSMTEKLRETIADLEASQATFRNIIESVPIGMYMFHVDPNGRLIYDGSNPAAEGLFSSAAESAAGQPMREAFPALAVTELPDRYQKVAAEGEDWQTELIYTGNSASVSVAGEEIQNIYQIYAFQTSPDNMVAAVIDVTDSRRAEEERAILQQEIIDAQQRAIQELSSPVIPVMSEIIVMPLIGSVDSMRAKDITRALLAGISRHQARIVIIDVTGVPIVDSGVANHLNKTIMAARLKGAQAFVTGISDAVAETIVDLGIDWSSITTLNDLQTGLVAALNELGVKLVNNEDNGW